jgi:LuxR family maltose regulon positive regulatory protein
LASDTQRPVQSSPADETDHHTAPGVAEAGEPAVLLAAKWAPPAIRAQLIERAALIEILSAEPSGKLTLLSAPAGWGKTTLLAQWAGGADDRRRRGWLSLDASDNDPARFWACAIAALRKASPGVAPRAFELIRMGADAREVVLPTLLNELAAVDYQIALILDDYHLVENRTVHEQVGFVVERMPQTFRLVIATRSDPVLPLARLRARGELLELRAEELRFQAGEAAHLLDGLLGLKLTDAQVQLLFRRTEGWAAGLYLAGLSLAGRADAAAFIQTFAGDNRHIVDYLIAEVLDGQPPHIRSFLLRTSLLDRLSGALCDAVLQTSGSASVLETIERDNLFLLPLDVSRRWYRYHQLFADLLRTELHRSEPDLIPNLHQRASAWFAGEGLIDEAVHHLVAAGDMQGAAELIAARWAAAFNRGRVSTVSGWLDALPPQTVSGNPRLSLAGRGSRCTRATSTTPAAGSKRCRPRAEATPPMLTTSARRSSCCARCTVSGPATSLRPWRRRGGRSVLTWARRRGPGRPLTVFMDLRCTSRATPTTPKAPSGRPWRWPRKSAITSPAATRWAIWQ